MQSGAPNPINQLPNQPLQMPPVVCPKLPPKVSTAQTVIPDEPSLLPTSENKDDYDWRQLHDETLKRLQIELNQLKPKIGTKDTNELERRLQLMSTAWLEHRLDTRLQHRLRDISLGKNI